MKIQDLKITSEDYVSKDIVGLPDRPSEAGMSAQALKERFDASTKHIVQPKFNQLIEILTSTEGADNIGITPIEGVAGYTVQQFLMAIKLLLDDKKNAEQSDREIAQKFDTSEAQALVKEVTFSESTGVFTITKYDGTVLTIDTAIEKVALDVRLDGKQFVLTLADGSKQRVDLSAFLTQTEVKNSDTITLSIESGAIVARIASGSVKLAHLNAEVTAYIEEKEQSAKNSADAAKVSEQNALNSANSAEQSYQNAKACQEQSCLCATQAELSRQAASKSEQAAKEAAEKAKEAAGGDFVTNTEFNNFKENVPTLSDDKLPVQSGGWYIDENTTEEDKAEALAGFVGVGAFGYSRRILSGEDLNDIVNPGGYYTGMNDSPYILNIPDDGAAGFHLYVLKADSSLSALNGYRTLQIYVRANTDDAIWIRSRQVTTWRPWVKIADASKFLPLDGSVPMSGMSLGMLNNKGKLMCDGNATAMINYKVANDSTNRRQIGVYSDDLEPQVRYAIKFGSIVDGKATLYMMHGDHNKPRGTYTGNGSSAERTIAIGGIGSILYISSDRCSALVSTHGAIYWSGNSGYTTNSSIKFAGSVLTITSSSQYFNESNLTYSYQLL